MFARERQIHNIDDFDQINDDLRPFWAVEPSLIRNQAAHCVDNIDDHLSIVAIRNGRAYIPLEGWRPEAFVKFVGRISDRLPDMDIALNIMDQPRVVVPWDQLQQMLKLEEQTRSLDTDGVEDGFTRHMSNFWLPTDTVPDRIWIKALGIPWFWDSFVAPVIGSVDTVDDYGWFWYTAKQYMDVASKGCPPHSYARRTDSAESAEASYKDHNSGLVSNYNLSTDICTVGPQLANLHGMLYASTSMLASHTLLPVFSECKVSSNNDILYPANIYFVNDRRYDYNDRDDIEWDLKNDIMVWRGVTSGGTTHAEEGDRWKQMHRSRLVLLTNSTLLESDTEPLLALTDADDSAGTFSMHDFMPVDFASEHTDVGFTETMFCLPDCEFLDRELTMLNSIGFEETFRSKYLVDVDGMSFSGRWRAFLQSRSLGLKATIFREWHDSRLFAWRHFVPMDNRFDDLYSLLAYFIGVEQQQTSSSGQRRTVKVPRHDFEAFTIAQEGRAWASKVLRREDIEIYLYRLLLEYGRIIDDNRHRIGFVGDGGQEMVAFDEKFPAVD